MDQFAEWHQVVGVVGTITYIGTYFIVQIGKMRAPGYAYCILNILAAALVGVSLIYEFNLASAVIQISWILISMAGIRCLMIADKGNTGSKPRRLRQQYGVGGKLLPDSAKEQRADSIVHARLSMDFS